ncbi:MAG: type ISP restriction/modification enzyme [Planctomycetota bacterium]|nr:type ISP restriction/modification enzyme [Planctomycetota bacterium]
MNPVEEYYRSLGEIHRSHSGVPETSYYPALETLLSEIGKTLTPKVRCIINLANAGAGIPDGGIFSADQLKRQRADNDDSIQIPERGAIEVKPPDEDPRETIQSDQGRKYLSRYGLVLVTNLRQFVLFERGDDGGAVEIEAYDLAVDQKAFWLLCDQPKKGAQRHVDLFPEYLRRVLTRKTRLSEPADLAWFLASYARQAKTVVEWKELETLAPIRCALEEVLGLKFEGEKGDHFFKSTLVQTLFYGLFAAWVVWSKKPESRKPDARFDWRMAQWDLKIPMIGALFSQVANAQQLDEEDLRDLVAPLDRAADALNRVDRPAFFARFAESEAVQYFYEPFLQAFDPELRKDLGVWYTPREIVRYMVERVDVVLRTELGIEDGLADPRVYVLDPCCGTGAFLVEVLQRIQRTLKDKGDDALVAQGLKTAARERVFGFEIMPAPFVVAHLQLGLLLETLGAPLKTSGNERVGVYLTNALTGWEPPKKPKDVLFKELEAERDAAEKVKRDKPILVVLGNPPYNAFAGVSPAEEDGLVEPYKEGLSKEWGIRKFNLDDLYVRFFRIAEQRIVEKTGEGIVCFVSNFSYLSDASFVEMRRRLQQGFDHIWIDCLNGDSRETGKLTPDGKPDPSAFSTEQNPQGIKVGTAIGLFARRPRTRTKQKVHATEFREFWGREKRADLLNSLDAKEKRFAYKAANPDQTNRYSFIPSTVSDRYLSWPKLVDLCAINPANGLMEKRGGALIDIDRAALERRMRAYFDPKVEWSGLQEIVPGLTTKAARFDSPSSVRNKLINAETFETDRVRRYFLRPLDSRWCYYSGVRPLWNEPRPTLWALHRAGTPFLVCRPAGVAQPEGVPFFFTKLLGDNDALRGHAYYFALRLAADDQVAETPLFAADEPAARWKPNLSASAREYLRTLGLRDFDSDPNSAALIWLHALAIGFAPAYLCDNADGVRQDWPRIPLPKSRAALMTSAELGERIAALLDTDTPIKHVDTGAPRAELKVIGTLARFDSSAVNPDAGHLDVDVGWGHAGKDGATMPGKGKWIAREYTNAERDALKEGAKALGLTLEQALDALGRTTRDVQLNAVTYWRNVPSSVWEFVIGGYQVIKKWLSYREHDMLVRSLTIDEARHVTSMARRLAVIALLREQLNANYRACADEFHASPASDTTAE